MGAYIINVPDTVDTIIYVNIGDVYDGKTYIASQRVEDLTPYTEPDLEQVRKEGYDKGMDDAEMLAYKLYSPKIDEAYQRGLSDAWEAARKIILPSKRGGVTVDEFALTFGCDISKYDVIEKYSASEAIEKIRQYEQEQEVAEIKVGDEVKSIECGWTAIVTKSEEGHLTLMGDSGAIANGYDAKYFAKTGRHFPEIAAVLEKMREDAT